MDLYTIRKDIKTFCWYILADNNHIKNMMLTPNQTNDVMKRFPSFELSYETISHKKVPEHYDLCIAIPQGKKAFLWFTFFNDKNVCFLLTLGRDKKVVEISMIVSNVSGSLAMNTIIYGSLCQSVSEEVADSFFIFEDIYFYRGLPLAKLSVSEKLGFLYDFLQQSLPYLSTPSLHFALPVMWTHPLQNYPTKSIPYTVHHIQYRSFTGISSYLNEKLNDKIYPGVISTLGVAYHEPLILPDEPRIMARLDYSKPQYRLSTIFEIKADLQYDIYHLYAYGKDSSRVYCGMAGITSCKSSAFMNHLFRNIKENRNLDAIEESDDEEDFQDMRLDKYVDLAKKVALECRFNTKFKRWIPERIAQKHQKVVHISKL
jgi:hypothetical protein